MLIIVSERTLLLKPSTFCFTTTNLLSLPHKFLMNYIYPSIIIVILEKTYIIGIVPLTPQF